MFVGSEDRYARWVLEATGSVVGSGRSMRGLAVDHCLGAQDDIRKSNEP
jgi:hypothetical protein